MREPLTDTSAEAERELVELVRRAPVWKRVALAASLCDATRALALADLRRRHPEASDEELRRRLAFRLLSEDEVKRAYGWDAASLGG
jgi:hypothetical protein